MSLLEVRNMTKRFGGLVANNDISFSVEEGQIFSVIGPNGAGKSTVFKLICGFLRPTSGKVSFRGEDINERRVMSAVMPSAAPSDNEPTSPMNICAG